jgi:cold-inducible RNA-binding protein
LKIYAGNLAPEVTEEELRKEFEAFGQVATADIIKDRFTARPKGFAFVEMPAVAEGQAAIAGLNGKMLRDRTLTVNAARPRTEDGGSRSQGDRRGGEFGGGSGKRSRY